MSTPTTTQTQPTTTKPAQAGQATKPARQTRTTKTPATPATPAAKTPAQTKAAEQAKPKTAAEWRREIDLLLIRAAGDLVKEHVPTGLRAEVSQLIANQLHHLSTPKAGWPSSLPKPQRSDWR